MREWSRSLDPGHFNRAAAVRRPELGRPPASSDVSAGGEEHSLLDLLQTDAFRLSIAAVLFINLTRIHDHFSFLSQIQAPTLAIGAAAVALLFQPSAANLSALRTRFAAVVAGIAGMACLSVPFGISLGASGSFMVSVYGKVLLVTLLMMVSMRSARDVERFVWVYVLGCGVWVWYAVGVFEVQDLGYTQRIESLYMRDSNDVGAIFALGLPLALVTFRSSRNIGKWVSAAIIVGIGVSIARTGSRGGFLAIGAVALSLVLLGRGISIPKRLGIIVLLAGGLYAAAPSGYWTQIQTLTNPTDDYNWTSEVGRKELAERAINYALRYPAAGVGIGNFQMAEVTISEMARRRELGLRDKGVRMTAPHNTHLQVASEIGIPGFFFWCLLFGGGTIWSLLLSRRLPEWWATADRERRVVYYTAQYLPMSIIGFGVGSTFVSLAWGQLPLFLAILLIGLEVVVRREEIPEPAASGHPRHEVTSPTRS